MKDPLYKHHHNLQLLELALWHVQQGHQARAASLIRAYVTREQERRASRRGGGTDTVREHWFRVELWCAIMGVPELERAA